MNLLRLFPAPSALTRILLALALAAPAALFAEALQWDNNSQSFETTFDQESLTAAYAFTNTSANTVTIVEAKASCGCTVPSLDKKVYAPGETGNLNAIFTIGSRQGAQHKVITVVTEDDAGESATYELKLEVNIPVPVTLTPRVRFWTLNETAETQEIDILLNEKMPLTISALARKDHDDPISFDYELETITPGIHYRLKLTPRTPNAKSRNVFHLVSDQDSKKVLSRYPIYAYVR